MDRNNVLLIILLAFFSLFETCVPKRTRNKDVQKQARLNLDPAFIKRLEDDMLLQSRLSQEIEFADLKYAKIEMNEVDDFLERIISKRSRKEGENHKPLLVEYKERYQKNGKESLKAVAEHLQRKLNVAPDVVTTIFMEIYLKYVSKLKGYFGFLEKIKPQHDIDKEYIVLDMVNIVSSLLNSAEKTLLNRVLVESDNTTKEDKQILTETIHIYNTNYKKREMTHICGTLDVCRPCPGFSDHLVLLLSEVLKLHDVKFQYFILKSSQLLINKRIVFATILKEEIIDWFKEKTTNIMNASIADAREFISVLRSSISPKERLVITKDNHIKTKTKASRIIKDIIDNTYDIYGDEYISMQIESTISGIREWAASQRNDIESILRNFINQIVSTIKFYLDPVAKDEIKTLGDIIFYGKAVGNQFIEEYLLEKGSKFMNGRVPQKKRILTRL